MRSLHFNFVSFSLIDIILSFLLRHKWVNKHASHILVVIKEAAFDFIAFAVSEFSTAFHPSVFPVALVLVSLVFPFEKAIAVDHVMLEGSLVGRAVWENEVAFAMFLVAVPLAFVLAKDALAFSAAVAVDAEAVPDSPELRDVTRVLCIVSLLLLDVAFSLLDVFDEAVILVHVSYLPIVDATALELPALEV